MTRSLLLTAALLGTTSAAFAAPLQFTKTAAGVLNTIEINGTVVNGADLVGITLTDIDQVGTRLLIPTGATVPADRSSLLEDASVNTGVVNLTSFKAVFNTPITNNAGIDAVLIDFGESANDSFSLSLDGSPLVNFGGADRVVTDFGANGFNAQLTSNPGPNVSTVAELEAATFGGLSAIANRTGATYGIDFSAFGIADGATVTGFTFSNGVGTDPVFVGGVVVPEPASMALLAAGSVLMMGRRRTA